MNRSPRYDFLPETKKVVCSEIGPSNVKTDSVALTRMLPDRRSGFPSRCLIMNVDANALSYRASKAEELNFKLSIKETLACLEHRLNFLVSESDSIPEFLFHLNNKRSH